MQVTLVGEKHLSVPIQKKTRTISSSSISLKSIPKKKKQSTEIKPPVIVDAASSISSELSIKGALVAEPIQKSRSFAVGDRQTEIVMLNNKVSCSSLSSSSDDRNKHTPMSKLD